MDKHNLWINNWELAQVVDIFGSKPHRMGSEKWKERERDLENYGNIRKVLVIKTKMERISEYVHVIQCAYGEPPKYWIWITVNRNSILNTWRGSIFPAVVSLKHKMLPVRPKPLDVSLTDGQTNRFIAAYLMHKWQYNVQFSSTDNHCENPFLISCTTPKDRVIFPIYFVWLVI